MKAGGVTAVKLGTILFVAFGLFIQRANSQALVYQQLKSFGYLSASGGSPQARVIEGKDGALYGTASAGGAEGVGVVFKMNKDGSGYTVLHHFTPTSGDGATPLAPLLQASDGKLYGTTQQGGVGINTNGTVFVLNTDGSGYAILHSFSSAASDGQAPAANLIEGSDGNLYGTTQNGGASGLGVVFAIAKDGSGYISLHSFAGGTTDGAQPICGLIESVDGYLYGTTQNGGSLNDFGTIFKLTKTGTGYAVIHTFAGGSNDGSYPKGALVRGNSFLYGTTANGGGNKDAGTIFKISTNGATFSVLHSFTGDVPGTDGGYPAAGLVLGTNGNLYGNTQYGGTSDAGTIFKVNTNGTGYGVLLTLTYTNNYGGYPNAPLLDASDTALYGVTPNGGPSDAGTAFKLNKDGTGYALLRVFNVTGNDGYNARATLREASDGYLYGVTQQGGTNGNGTVFKIAKDGSGYLNIHDFNNGSADGQLPSGLIEASDGFLYGTTFLRGTNGGAIFRMNKAGTSYSLLHNFGSIANDGGYPYAAPLEGSDGVLYGTTYYGGTNSAGALYRMNKDGTGYTNMHSFGSSGDGQSPYAGLVEGIDGALYGTTTAGGSNGVGTVFRIGKNGSGFTNIHHFGKPTNDGKNPYATLYKASDGLMYGCTLNGGTNNNGTIFRINTNGSSYTVLHWFDPTAGEGTKGYGGLIERNDGSLYGATQNGGTYNGGTIFRIVKDGTAFATVHHLGASHDGATPMAGLTFASNGALYGPTDDGGTMNAGTLFEMFPAAPPSFSNVPSDTLAQCDAVPVATSPTATVYCGSLVGVTMTQASTQAASGSGRANYTITRTWTAADSCGDSNSVSQIITVVDTTAPVLSGTPTNITIEYGALPPVAFPIATDNCDTNPTVTFVETSTQTESGCGHGNYTVTRTWTASDASGNSSSKTQSINVVDFVAPVLSGVPADTTVQCDAIPPVTNPTATDNADPAPIISFQESSGNPTQGCGAGRYVLTRIWTAADACGNSSSAQQSITVIDTNAPVILIQPTPVIALAHSCVSNGVTVAGTAPLSYQWLLDDVAIADETNSTLIVSNFLEAQCGNYTVVVSNSFGAVTSSVAAAGCYDVKSFGDALQFSISGVAGQQYGLEFQNSCEGSWQVLTNLTLVTNNTIVWDGIGSPDPQRFYRAFTSP